MERNDSSIDLCQKVKNDDYHLGQLNRPVSQIDIQRNMVGFVMEGHIWYVRIINPQRMHFRYTVTKINDDHCHHLPRCDHGMTVRSCQF